MRKKGSVLDLFWLMVTMFVVCIAVLVGTYLKDQVFPQLKAVLGTESSAGTYMDLASMGFQTLDYAFLFITMMTGGAAIILAFFVENHPVFFFVNIILLGILLLVSPAISNAARSFWALPQFAPYASGGGGSVTYPIMTQLMRWMPLVLAAIGTVLSIAQFAKPRGE